MSEAESETEAPIRHEHSARSRAARDRESLVERWWGHGADDGGRRSVLG